MLRIRLQRTGRRNTPFFRIVVSDKRNATKTGRFIEVVGAYDPKAGAVTFQKDRVEHWLANGAQPSGTVHNFLVDKGIISGDKINVLPQKEPVVSEQNEEEAPQEAESTDTSEEAEAPQEEETKETEEAEATS